MQKCSEIELTDSQFIPANITGLNDCKLEVLKLTGSTIELPIADKKSAMSHLRCLELNMSKLTVPESVQFSNLTVLRLEGTDFNKANLEKFGKSLTGLKHLTLIFEKYVDSYADTFGLIQLLPEELIC